MFDDGVMVMVIKLGGSIAGTALALIYLQPKTKADFVTRSAYSIIAGMVFSEAARDFAKWPDTANYQIASSALTAMLSWFIMGTLVKIIKGWQPPK